MQPSTEDAVEYLERANLPTADKSRPYGQTMEGARANSGTLQVLMHSPSPHWGLTYDSRA